MLYTSIPLPTLSTSRLLLRPLILSDAPEIQLMASEKCIADTCQIPHPYPEGEAEDWIRTQQAAFDRREEMALGIMTQEYEELVGTVALTAIFEGHQAELGFWIGRKYWGNGYATESCRAVVSYGFETFNLIRIHACHLSRNEASARVLAKIGMKLEGISPKHFIKWGIPEDITFWGMLNENCTS